MRAPDAAYWLGIMFTDGTVGETADTGRSAGDISLDSPERDRGRPRQVAGLPRC